MNDYKTLKRDYEKGSIELENIKMEILNLESESWILNLNLDES